MKKLILASVTLFAILSTSTFAQDSSAGDGPANSGLTDKASLNTFKMIIESSRDSIKSLALETADRLDNYNSLGAFNLAGKSRARKENCGNVKATLAAGLLMIGTSLEHSRDSLKRLNISDSDSNELEIGFNSMISKSKEAIDKCRDIEKSLNAVHKAHTGIDRVTVVLERIIPKLID